MYNLSATSNFLRLYSDPVVVYITMYMYTYVRTHALN